ncbi:hypothetical protein CK203_100831 [Vitis vinifera]|uniref:Uncharacterized protein n=1 Tax=Vitis vinifera TaxID=29760 RepID=A0A438CKK2_VITVI|nr:hypothetical protein CK203_100831 [Vitis vinifera]
MSANKEVTSSGPVGDAPKKSIDKLSVKEFRDRFCIPNGVLVEFLDEEEVVSTEKAEGRAITFSNEQFNAELQFPLPVLFKEFLHFTQIPPAFIHPNIVRVLMGCSILNMLFNLDLSLLEVLFVYSLKKGKNDIFSMAAHLPSLQLVTELPDSTKGGAKGYVVVRGAWAGLLEHPERSFSLNYSLVLSGSDKRGHVVEWVEKASFVRLNKLFEITAAERQFTTLLTARNLMAVVREPHLPFYKEVQQADAEKCQALLDDQERRKNGETLRKAPGKKRSVSSPPAGAPTKKKKKTFENGKEVEIPPPPKEVVIPPSTYVKEETIKEPKNPVPVSVSSGPGHLAGLNQSGPSMSVAGHLALVVEEATSINQPSSSHPDADAVEASCAAVSPPMATPLEEMGVENQGLPSCEPSPLVLVPVKGPASRRSSSAQNLKSGLLGRLQDQFQETIEVSCSSVQDDHPEGSETEMETETPTVPMVVPDEGTPGETHPAENDGAPDPGEESLSNASSGRILLMMRLAPLLALLAMRSWKRSLSRFHPARPLSCLQKRCLKWWKRYTLVSGLRGMAQQHDLFTDLLRTTDYMKAFTSQRKNSEGQLRLRLEEAKTNLSTARGENEALRVDLAEAKSREDSMETRLHEAEDEVALLWGEVRHLRTEVSIEKKQREDLQLRLSAQKEELEGEFAMENEKLEANYQKQVDDMFFFGYRYCMKKNGIKRDVPSIPPGEKKKLLDKSAP